MLLFRAATSDNDAEDNDDNDQPRMHLKWSKPVVQRQRLAYMNNLNAKARSCETHEADQFNERFTYVKFFIQ